MNTMKVVKTAQTGHYPQVDFYLDGTKIVSLTEASRKLLNCTEAWDGGVFLKDFKPRYKLFHRGKATVEVKLLPYNPDMEAERIMEVIIHNITLVKKAFEAKYPAVNETAVSFITV